ncbi:hypothetical protein GPALN_004596 [Globodera pallida]|nr:hypothetical protein GPALN_004596 [Globodera pallida]
MNDDFTIVDNLSDTLTTQKLLNGSTQQQEISSNASYEYLTTPIYPVDLSSNSTPSQNLLNETKNAQMGRFFIAKKARNCEFVPFVNELVGINSNFVGMLRRINLHCVQHRERLRRARWAAKMRVGPSHCVQHKVREWPPVHCAQRSSNVHNNKSMKPAQYL